MCAFISHIAGTNDKLILWCECDCLTANDHLGENEELFAIEFDHLSAGLYIIRIVTL